ncbi:hypothetical protein DFH07DRAFT_1038550 [Mycena maculata]|uniref:F-box domain-containing protein n=1 Tax=Mycena maculata TaxID=230809 RepID=A0AAD7IP80_9AGAR|nr:hypothetical protein DFH07DRAFT_1038550 [Mycena maculata]
MHRALEIVELVENICAHLGPADLVSLKTDATRDLALLARTSTIFLNPALDVLWRSQDSLVHLLRCMPHDLLVIPEVGPPRRHVRTIAPPIRLRRPILPTDWERPLFYMCRVKFFSMGNPARISDVLDVFGQCPPAQYVFPNLEKLWWHEPPFKHFSLFFTPRLTSIRLFDVEADFSVVSNHILRCTHLKSVVLCVKRGDYDPAARSSWPFSSIVRCLTHIEDLHVPEIDSTAMEHLAQLPCLKGLHFSYQSALEEPRPFERSVRFPALIQLGVPLVTVATTLLKFFWQTPLEKLVMNGTDRIPMTKMAASEFYSTLAAHCAHASLSEIWNSGQTFLVEPTPEQILTYSVAGDILQPLFSFSNLHKVELRHPVGFDLDNATILDMARSWPHITIIKLVASTTRHMPTRVTLEGLYAFAEHCPQLRDLTLTFDATLVSRTPPSDEPRHNQLCLQCLNVECSLVGDPGPVAEFLFSIFPRLWAIRTAQKNFADGAWKPVSTRFKELRDGEKSRSPTKASCFPTPSVGIILTIRSVVVTI